MNKRGAGLLLGVVTGILATFMGFGHHGPLEWTKWVAAGIVLDVLGARLPGDLRSPLKASIVGAALHLAKLASIVLAGSSCACRSPCVSSASACRPRPIVVFGAVGGLLGALALRQLRKVPALDAQARGD